MVSELDRESGAMPRTTASMKTPGTVPIGTIVPNIASLTLMISE